MGVETAPIPGGRGVRCAYLTLWVLVAGMFMVAWYGASRGFDLLDSGCYYLEYAFPGDSADTHTSYRFFAAPLFSAVGENIIAFRWLSWAFLWLSSGVLGWGMVRFLRVVLPRAGMPTGAAVVPVLLLAGSSAYAIKPVALTYNSLNLIAVNIALGLFFGGIVKLDERAGPGSWRALGLIAAAFWIAAIEFFIKPTTSVFLLGSLFALGLLLPTVSAFWKKRLMLATVVAGALGTVGMLAVLGGIQGLLVRFETLISIARNQAYMGVLLERTGREFRELSDFLAADLRLPGLLLLIGTVVAAFQRLRGKPIGLIASATGLAVVVSWVHLVVASGLWKGSHQLYMHGYVARAYLSLLILATLALLVTRLLKGGGVKPSSASITGALVWALLVATPFAGAFGSTTSVYLNGALYATCWTGALLLVLAGLRQYWGASWVYPSALVPLAGCALAQVYHGQVHMPYMQNKPLWENTVPVPFGVSGSVIRVDPDTAQFVEAIRTALVSNGFKRGDDLFSFFNLPGVVFAVGGKSPVIPWYFGRIYAGDPVEEHYMRVAGPERVKRAWLLTQDDVSKFRDHFAKGGINFPSGYERVLHMKSPFTALDIGVWKPVDAVVSP